MAKSPMGMQYAGEYNILECKLVTHAGAEIDLIDVLIEVNVYEELFSNAISADITFVDTKDLSETLPIIGNEYVRLEIGTPEETNEGSIDFTKHTFVVYKILQEVDVNQGKMISLKLTTNEIFLNNRRRVSQSFTGAYSEMVEKIFRGENYLNCDKQLKLEDTVGGFSFVVPNMHPFDAINSIAQRSLSRFETSSYIFYETTRGYNFRSIESLFEEGPVMEYNVGEGDIHEKKGVNPQEVNLNQIESEKIISSNDILNGIRTGLYASKMILHDSFNKTYSETPFSYKESFSKGNDVETLGGGQGKPLFPLESVLDTQGNTVSDYSDSLVTVQSSTGPDSFHTGTYPEFRTPYGKVNPGSDILNRFSKLSQIANGISYYLEIVGNTGIEVGQLLELNIPKNQTDAGELYNEKVSGRYIIKKLKHSFLRYGDNKHRIGLEVVKDSTQLSFPDDLPDPGSGSGGTVTI